MITRDKVEPDFGLVLVETEDRKIFRAKHVVGIKSYDGWYIPSIRKLIPQRELRVCRFINRFVDYEDSSWDCDDNEWKEYLPKNILDLVFGNRQQLDPITFNTRTILAKAGELLPGEEW